jgi:hypothetical protein
MRVAPEITTNWLNENDQKNLPQSEVLLNGCPTGSLIPGALLEAAIEWNGHYLLFLTDDCPFEEGLNIVMLDSTLKLLDYATLAVLYCTGTLTSLKLLAPDRVQFTFFHEQVWTVQLLSKFRLGLPVFGEMGFVIWRPWSFLRRFVIHLHPAELTTPQTSVTTVIDIAPSVADDPSPTMWVTIEIDAIWINRLDQGRAPKCKILEYDIPSKTVLDGANLDIALCCGLHFLLFLSDHTGPESILHIVMLERMSLKVMDRARLTGGAVLTSMKLIEPHWLQFSCYPGTLWTLQFLPKPRLAPPFLGGKVGNIWRPCGFWRHFLIHPDATTLDIDATAARRVVKLKSRARRRARMPVDTHHLIAG